MELAQALALLATRGVLLEAAQGPVPNLAEAIVGAPITGSWWGHPQGQVVFQLTRQMREHPDVLACKLVQDKVTYVHRRLWPALARLADRLGPERLARLVEQHSLTGTHVVRTQPFPQWCPDDVLRAGEKLGEAEAEALLAAVGVNV